MLVSGVGAGPDPEAQNDDGRDGDVDNRAQQGASADDRAGPGKKRGRKPRAAQGNRGAPAGRSRLGCCSYERTNCQLVARLCTLSGHALTTDEEIERRFIKRRLFSEAGYLVAVAFFLTWSCIYLSILITALYLIDDFAVNKTIECAIPNFECSSAGDCVSVSISMLMLGVCGSFLFTFLTCMSCGLRKIKKELAYEQYERDPDRTFNRARRRATAGESRTSALRMQIEHLSPDTSVPHPRLSTAFSHESSQQNGSASARSRVSSAALSTMEPSHSATESAAHVQVDSTRSSEYPEDDDDDTAYTGMRTISRRSSDLTIVSDGDADIDSYKEGVQEEGGSEEKQDHTALQVHENEPSSIVGATADHAASMDIITSQSSPALPPPRSVEGAESLDARSLSRSASASGDSRLFTTLERNLSLIGITRKSSRPSQCNGSELSFEDVEVDPIQEGEDADDARAGGHGPYDYRPFKDCDCLRPAQCCLHTCPSAYFDPTELVIPLGRNRRFDTDCLVHWTQIGAQCCMFPWIILILTATITVVARTNPSDFNTYEGLCAVNYTVSESTFETSDESQQQRTIHNRAVALTWFAVLFTWVVLSGFGVNALVKTAMKKCSEARATFLMQN